MKLLKWPGIKKFIKGKEVFKMSWYQLNVATAPTNANSYSEIPNPNGCAGNSQICAIQATEGDPGKPELTDELLDEMLQAVNTHTNTTNVKLKA